MKATFFSFLSLSTAAFAAPIAHLPEPNKLSAAGGVLLTAGGIAKVLPVARGVLSAAEEIVHADGRILPTPMDAVKVLPVARGLLTAAEELVDPVPDNLVTTVEGLGLRSTVTVTTVKTQFTTLITTIKGYTENINGTISQVQAGSITKSSAITLVVGQVTSIHTEISAVVDSLMTTVGLTFAGDDVTEILDLVFELVAEIIGTVNGVVAVLGLEGLLMPILTSLFILVGSLLAVVVSLLGNVLTLVNNLLSSVVISISVTSVTQSLLTSLVSVVPGLLL
jgi:hypothetical protein